MVFCIVLSSNPNATLYLRAEGTETTTEMPEQTSSTEKTEEKTQSSEIKRSAEEQTPSEESSEKSKENASAPSSEEKEEQTDPQTSNLSTETSTETGEEDVPEKDEPIVSADYVEKKDVSASDVQGTASLREEEAQKELSSVGDLPKKKSLTVARNILKAPNRSDPMPVLIEGVDRSGDGSNIESIIAKWITEDTVDDGDRARLYVKPEEDENQTVILQINYALSGEHNYEPGDVTITIPKNIFKDRNGRDTGSILIPYAEDPSRKNDFNWKEVGDTYVLTSTKPMSAATKGYVQFAFEELVPHKLVDMQESAPFDATIEVVTHRGNTIGLKSNPLTAQFDTEARVTDVEKHVSGVPTRVPAEEIPEAQRVAGETEYVKVDWYVHGEIESNTMYRLTAVDTIPDEYQGFIINGSEKRKDTRELSHDYREGETSYYSYSTAYPASQFQPDVEYTFHNNIEFILLEDDPDATVINPNVGEDPQLRTTVTADALVKYEYNLPRWQDPTGHFMVVKNGNDDTEKNNITHKSKYSGSDLHLWSRDPYGWYGIYPSGLNDLQDERKAHGSNGGIRLSYTINSIGYVMPWMFESDSYNIDHEMAPRKSINYTRPVSMTTRDKGLSIARYGEKMAVGTDYDYLGVEFPNIPWIYTGTPHNINPDGSWKAVTAGDGTFLYTRDNDKTHIPDIVMEIQKSDGTWEEYATASWKTGDRVVTKKTGETMPDGFVPFPDGVRNFRTKVILQNTSTDAERNEALQAAIDYDVRVVVNLHSTKKMEVIIDNLFQASKVPSMSIWNEAEMIAEREDEPKADETKRITLLDNDGYDSVRGYTTDISVYPKKTAKQELKDINFLKGEVTIHYNAEVNERSFIYDKKTYQQAVEDGRLIEETEGIWRDLLPKGMNPVLSSIKLRESDKILDIHTIEDYKGSGRTLLVVKAKLKNDPKATQVGDVFYYQDTPKISFDATYGFSEMTDYGKTLHNVISFESGNDRIGTLEGYSGEPDDPSVGNNVASDNAFADDREREFMTDLNPDRDTPSFVYAGTTTTLNVISAARTSLSKDVMVNNDGRWADGLYYDDPEGNKLTVYEGGQYKYRLRMMSDADTISKDLILYDSLENFYAGNGNDEIDIDAPRWQGDFRSMDVSQLEEMGCAPVVYYSTVENLQLSDETNPNQANTTNVKLQAPTWVKASEYQGELKNVKAIAVDASKDKDGNDFVLQPGQSVVVYVNMHAPEGEPARTYISQKGVWGDSAHAYNNCYLLCTSIDVDTLVADSDNFVRKDYTKIGLIEHEIKVKKEWDDGENRDGKRPESVTVHLYADGNDTGKTLTLPVSVTDPLTQEVTQEWEASFTNIPYTDPDGRKILYSIREDETEGYSPTIFLEEGEFLLTNVHEPEKTSISGSKTWEGDEASSRPSSIIVSLYGNGNLVASKTVKPDSKGDWKYEFKDLYKYENGQEIQYVVKETSNGESIRSYIPETDGHDIKNTYHPYGDLLVSKTLKNATPKAAEKEFPFTFEFVKEGQPLFNLFDYEIREGETLVSEGQVKTNDTINIKGGQSIKVKEIPQGTDYMVREGEVQAFTLTNSQNTVGTIRPNETKKAVFENTYKASGKISFDATKKLLNQELRRANFFFDVILVSGNEETVVKSASNAKADVVVKENGSPTVQYSTAPVSFGAIRYTEEDVGKTYVYKIRERNRGWDYITFDDSEYTVEVTVTDENGDGNLTVTPVYKKGNETITPEDVLFVNEYHASGSTQFNAWKSLSGRDLKKKEFTFELYNENGDKIQTKMNDSLESETQTTPQEIYSHTDNISDDGTKLSDYESNRPYTNIVTIPGAESLHVELRYSNVRGQFRIWEGSHSEVHTQSYNNNFNPDTALKKYTYINGKDNEMQTDSFDVQGDSLSILYSSYAYPSSYGSYTDMINYGYYAVISTQNQTEAESDNSVIQFDALNFTEKDIGKTFYYTAREKIPNNAVPYTYVNGTLTKADSSLTYQTASADEKNRYLWGDVSYNPENQTGGVIYDGRSQMYAITVIDNGNGTLAFEQNIVLENPSSWELYKSDGTTETPVIDEGTHTTKVISNEAKTLPELTEDMGLEDGTYVLKEKLNTGDVQKARQITYKITHEEGKFLVETVSGTLPVFENRLEPGKLTVAKGVLSGDESKEFHFRVRLHNPNGEKLDGNFHYETNEVRFEAMIDRSAFTNAVTSDSTPVYFKNASGVNKTDVLGKNGVRRVDDGSTDYPVYLWRENRTFYWWSEAKDVFLPPESFHLFNFSYLKDIDLSGLNSSKVTDMSNMFYNCRYLQNVDLSGFDTGNATNMSNMFGGCNKLQSLDLSGFDTSNVTNMQQMFAGCSKLQSLDVSGFDTSNVTNMQQMFAGCTNLQSLDLSDLDTGNVTNMSYMFYKSSNLQSLDLSVLDTGNVTDMSYIFANCTNLQNLDLSGLDTSNVTTMRNMFEGCTNLQSLDLSDLDTGNVTNMGVMFYGCKNLQSLDLSGFDTGNVTDMQKMFTDCHKLQSLNLSGFDTSNVTTMSNMFDNCLKLQSLDLSDFDTGNVKFMDSMFGSCEALTSLDLSNFDTSKVENMSYMFYGCKNLQNLDLSGLDTSNVTKMDDMFASCTNLQSLDVSGFDTGNVTNMSNMFYGCKNLQSLDLSGLDTGNVTNMQKMFTDCTNLQSLDVSGFDTGNVTNMQQMFYNCKKLQSLDVSGFDTGNVTNMSNMFSYCRTLQSLDTSGFDTGNVTNMSNMFQSCNNLQGLDVSNFDTGNVTDMRCMFSGCSKLQSLDVSGFDTGKVTDMGYMFSGCQKLQSLDVSGFDTGKVTDMGSMFYDCSSLQSLDLSVLDTGKVTDMNLMFSNCKNLQSLDVSNFDTGKVTNMSYMFSGCQKLPSLDVSNFDTGKVTTMSYMFNNCTSLVNIYVSEKWNTSKVGSSINMFNNDTNLPNFNPAVIDKTNAHYRTGGYLTYKASPTGKTNQNRLKSNIKAQRIQTKSKNSPTLKEKIITGLDNLFGVIEVNAAVVNSGTYGTCSWEIDDQGLLRIFPTNGTSGTLANNTGSDSPWRSYRSKIKKIFVESGVKAGTDCSHLFYGLNQCTEIDLSNFDTGNVTTMETMFSDCRNLQSLDVSGFDTGNVTDMRSMFSGCSSLNTIYVSELWKRTQVSSSTQMFYRCTNLPNYTSSSIDKTKAHYNTGGYLTYKAHTTSQLPLPKTFKNFNYNLTADNSSKSSIIPYPLDNDNKDNKSETFFNTISKEYSESGLEQFISNSKADLNQSLTSNAKTCMDYFLPESENVLARFVSKSEDVLDCFVAGMFDNVFNSLGGITVHAAVVNSGTSGTCSWEIDDAGILTIRPTDGVSGTLQSYTSGNGPWYSYRNKITKVVVEPGVKAGSECYHLFYNLRKCTEMDLSNLDTSNVMNMSYMFDGCSVLTSLDLSDWDTSLVTTMGGMFYNCSGLTNLDLSDLDTSLVTNMSYMFKDCSGLTSLDLSDWDTSSVTNMSYMFYNCSGLTSLDLSDWDTSLVTTMSSMFYNCNGLTNLNLSGWNTSKVTTMSFMFSDCSELQSLDVSNFDTSKAVSMLYMFNSCKQLSELILGENFNFKNASDALKDTVPDNQEYTGKWIREDKTYGPWTPAEMIQNYDGASMHGKWVWQERPTKYTVNYTAPDASGSMAPDRFRYDEDVTLPQGNFLKPGFVFDHWYDADKDVHYTDNVIPANTYAIGDNVTLTAVFIPKEGDTSLEDGYIDFTLKANEKITFDDLPAGTEYQVFEETENGWVLVSSSGDTGVIEPQTTSDALFMNRYVPGSTSVQFSGNKTLDGEPAALDSYSFTLSEGMVPIQTKKVGAGGTVMFDPISYTEAGDHVYTIRETNPQDPNIRYDTHVETIYVHVIDNGDGTLTNEVVYDNDGIVFSNETVKRTLTLNKTGENVTTANQNDVFTFNVTINGETQKVTCRMNDSVTIPDIPAGASYSVEEVDLPEGWTYKEGTAEEGTISATKDNIVTVTNTYNATGSIPLKAYKTMDKGSADEGQYEFQLLNSSNQPIQVKSNKQAQLDGKAIVEFDPISYSTEDIGKTFTYKIKEIIGNDPQISYDPTEYTVHVQVQDNGKGQLLVTEDHSEDDRIFRNAHKPASLKVTKHIQTMSPELANTEFNFTVALSDKENTYTAQRYSKEGELLSTVNIADGSTFSLRADEYLLAENLPDEMEYSIKEEEKVQWELVSSENAKGILVAGNLTEAVFNNAYTGKYQAQGTAVITATKNINTGVLNEEDDFQFELSDVNGDVIETKNIDSFGSLSSTVTFSPLTYTENDIGKTFTYYLKELAGDNEYVVYDTKQYQIEVSVLDNGDGTLNTDIAYVTFDNQSGDPNEEPQKILHHDPMVFTNERTGSLELRKNLYNSANTPIESEDSFEFRITLEDTLHEGADKIIYNKGLFKNNVATVKLVGNSSLIIDDIPAGMKYTIEESPLDGYEFLSSENETDTIVAGETKKAVFNNRKNVVYGSLKVRKLKSDKTVLPGVTFKLTNEAGESIEKTTDQDGMVFFEELPIGTYYLTETKTVKGFSLLKDTVKITLPLEVTETQATQQNLDVSTAVHDAVNHKYFYYDLNYDITDYSLLKLPITGHTPDSIPVIPLFLGIAFMMAGFYGKRKTKKNE